MTEQNIQLSVIGRNGQLSGSALESAKQLGYHSGLNNWKNKTQAKVLVEKVSVWRVKAFERTKILEHS
jgi:hypothetical protein